MRDFSKLIHGLVIIAGSGLLLLPVSVNAFYVQHNDLANFSFSTTVANNSGSNVSVLPEISIDPTSAIVSSAGSTSGVALSDASVLVADATDNLLGNVGPNATTGFTDQFLQVEMPYTNNGASLTVDDSSSGIKVPEPGSILLMGLGLIALFSVVRIRQG